ncbi:MAG: lamin tail domain-containing protein [Bacteroidota bacterium]|nr:lamin tail domain-containing protein [Bacteroidota bacterium]
MKNILFAAAALLLSVTSCLVKDEMYPYPAIGEISNTVAFDETDDVTVTAKVGAFVDIESVTIVYTAGSAKAATVKMTKGSGDEWTGVIPAQAVGTEVKYHVDATTKAGTVSSKEVSYTVGSAPINYAAIKLNELNGKDKFIELINTDAADVRITGINIQKDGKDVWTAPAYTMAAGERLVLYSEDVTADHPEVGEDFIFHSGLSAKKAVRVQLFNPSGESIDDFNLVECVKAATASYSRVPEGTGKWCFTDATPGAANSTDDSDPVEGLQE